MNKNILAITLSILSISFSSNVLAQEPANGDKKSLSLIADILNNEIDADNKEQQNKLNNKKDNLNNLSDINTPLNTGGAQYDVNVKTGLDDYEVQKNQLKNKIEQAKIDRENYQKEKILMGIRAQKELEYKKLLEQKQQEKLLKKKNEGGGETNVGNKQNFHNRQLELMKKQSF